MTAQGAFDGRGRGRGQALSHGGRLPSRARFPASSGKRSPPIHVPALSSAGSWYAGCSLLAGFAGPRCPIHLSVLSFLKTSLSSGLSPVKCSEALSRPFPPSSSRHIVSSFPSSLSPFSSSLPHFTDGIKQTWDMERGTPLDRGPLRAQSQILSSFRSPSLKGSLSPKLDL